MVYALSRYTKGDRKKKGKAYFEWDMGEINRKRKESTALNGEREEK